MRQLHECELGASREVQPVWGTQAGHRRPEAGGTGGCGWWVQCGWWVGVQRGVLFELVFGRLLDVCSQE